MQYSTLVYNLLLHAKLSCSILQNFTIFSKGPRPELNPVLNPVWKSVLIPVLRLAVDQVWDPTWNQVFNFVLTAKAKKGFRRPKKPPRAHQTPNQSFFD